MKICCACAIKKAATAFSADRRSSDGLQSVCKECCRARRRAAYAADPSAAREKRRAYYRANKQVVLAVNSRSRAKHSDSVNASKREWYERVKETEGFIRRGLEYRKATKAEKSEYDRRYRAEKAAELALKKLAWRAANTELVRVIRSTYKARRRAQEAAGDSTSRIAAWVSEQKKVCVWCGVGCEENFHIDHVEPLARGGAHRVSNLAIACPSCNLRKNAKNPVEFRQQMQCSR